MALKQYEMSYNNFLNTAKLFMFHGVQVKGNETLKLLRASASLMLTVLVFVVTCAIALYPSEDPTQRVFGSSAIQSETVDKTHFAYVCEWKAGNLGGSTVYNVDTNSKTVNGYKAVITDQAIYFVMHAVEHSIDLNKGALFTRDLKTTMGIHLAGSKRSCVKIFSVDS